MRRRCNGAKLTTEALELSVSLIRLQREREIAASKASSRIPEKETAAEAIDGRRQKRADFQREDALPSEAKPKRGSSINDAGNW